MAQTILAICDGEVNYSERLYAYLRNKESESLKVIWFTRLNELEEYLVNRRIDILLICPKMYEESNNLSNTDLVILLSSEKYSSEDGIAHIYKYQSAETIYKSVMRYCSMNNQAVIRRNCDKPLSIIGVYSPVKRSFQTTFAITAGQILAEKGKTLYINFESFSGFDSVMASKNKSDLMDLMYFWSCGAENFSYRLGSVLERIGSLDYIPPVHSFMNYEGISGKQWIEFIKAFEEYTDYEYLILDLSENVNGLFDVLRLCSKVYTLTDNKRISTAKISQYEALLSECSYEDVIDKTYKMSIPLFREIPESFEMYPYSDLARFIRKEISFDEEMKRESREVI